MSYILDALRRADAERERGRVPGLHAQAMPLRAGDVEPPQRVSRRGRVHRPVMLAAMLALLALLAAAVWWFFETAPEPSADRPAPTATPTTTPPSSAPPSKPPSKPPSTPSIANPVTRPVTPAAAPAAPPILAPTPAPAPVAAAPAAPKRPAPDVRPTPPDDPQTLPRVVDLPPPARAGLPPLQVSGTTYAENAALHMLIVDGKVVQEGQDIAPGLRVESIGPRSAVLNHQGRRLRLTY